MRMRFLRGAAVLGAAVLILGAGTPQTAPDFTLLDTAGKPLHLKEVLQGKKAVLVNFWATWCPACRSEIPKLVELNRKESANGFLVIGVDVGEPARKAASAQEKYAMTYPVLLDPDSAAAKSYGTVGLPFSVLIDAKSGKILGEYHEFSDALVKDAEKALR